MRNPIIAALIAISLLGAPASAQDEGEAEKVRNLLAPAVPGDQDAAIPEGTGSFDLSAMGKLEFHARNMPVVDALAQLRQLLRRNIVVDPNVTQRFTGDLYDLTLTQTLDAICKTTGLVAKDEGAFIYVAPAAVETRVYRLHWVRGTDLVTMLKPLLSSQGEITSTLAPEKGIVPDQETTGGDDYAAPDALVVRDVPAVLDKVAEVLAVVDVRPQQVLIEATILSATLDDSNQFGIDLSAVHGTDFLSYGATSPGGTDLSLGDLPSKLLDESTAALDTDLVSDFASGGLKFGVIKNNVGAFVRALAENTDSKVLANPSILVLNKQRGEVIVGRRDGYLTTIVTDTSSTQKVDFLETGTRLLFRPYIGDNGIVRLEVHPEDSNGGVTAEGLPFKETAEVTTNILVPSGQTVAIGGLFRERTISTTSKIPGLGDIPLVGHAFKSETDRVVKQEIIILLTPRVMDLPDAAAVPAAGERSEGLLTKGSSHLARSYLTAARRLIESGSVAEARSLLRAAEQAHPGLPEIAEVRRLLPARRARGSSPAMLDVDARIRARALGADPEREQAAPR